ncbi:MAG: hypothetical protein ACXV2J_13495 [Actinomycetes bacterium]
MADLLLPAAARARLGASGRLVSRPHGRVVHVAAPTERDVTSTGRLRKGQRPLCGQAAYPWRVCTVSGRPLCRRCSRTVQALIPAAVTLPHLTEQELRATITTASSGAALDAATALLCQAPAGLVARLSPLIRQQRTALGLTRPINVVLPPQHPRRAPRRRDLHEPDQEAS